MVDMGDPFEEDVMPTADVPAFAEVLSEITRGGSRVEGVGHLDIREFLQERVERGHSDDSRGQTQRR
jgi:hypothetical protein